MDKSITIDRINEIIDKEMEYAKKVNPQMCLGMAQIKKLLNREVYEYGKD